MRLLQASVLDVNSKQLQFKLAPTYTLYMAVRNLLGQRSPGPQHHAQLVADFVSKMASMTQQTIQVKQPRRFANNYALLVCLILFFP